MISFKSYLEELKKDPCWTGYKMLGMKKKGKREVPNCVPVSEEISIARPEHEIGGFRT